METGGRAFSDLYRNSSEELFLKTMMESPIGMPVPSLEMLGFKSASQNLRTDSEELFKRWLTNGESQSQGYHPSSLAPLTRQSQRRPNELSNLSNHQQVATLSKKRSNEKLFSQNIPMADVLPGNANEFPVRDADDQKEFQASDLFLAKAWFLSDQPMTRSRSSELRRRYAAMQIPQATLGMESLNNAPHYVNHPLKEEYSNGFNYIAANTVTPNQIGSFISPTNSSSSNFNTPQMVDGDKVSSCVSMLRGTLESKKLFSHSEKEADKNSTNGLYHAAEVVVNSRAIERKGSQFHEMARSLQEAANLQAKNTMFFQTGEGSADVDVDGFANPTNQIHSARPSREHSPSESSAAAQVVSSGFDAYDDSHQTLTVSESSHKQAGVSRSPENGHRAQDFRERIMDNLKDDKKRKTLEQYGPITSTISVEKGDHMKKRRVERSRKMAEAKERNLTPAIPSDMQAVLKRCEALEKEARSLKLNLSFMNRKDSEQTKQIEELQKQNEDLADEKERLLEEIERILSETGKI